MFAIFVASLCGLFLGYVVSQLRVLSVLYSALSKLPDADNKVGLAAPPREVVVQARMGGLGNVRGPIFSSCTPQLYSPGFAQGVIVVVILVILATFIALILVPASRMAEWERRARGSVDDRARTGFMSNLARRGSLGHLNFLPRNKAA